MSAPHRPKRKRRREGRPTKAASIAARRERVLPRLRRLRWGVARLFVPQAEVLPPLLPCRLRPSTGSGTGIPSSRLNSSRTKRCALERDPTLGNAVVAGPGRERRGARRERRMLYRSSTMSASSGAARRTRADCAAATWFIMERVVR